MSATLPSLEMLAALSGDASAASKHLQHNVQLWCWISGAFGMLKDETLAFDTQQDYWYRTDRRIVAAYLHRRLRCRFRARREIVYYLIAESVVECRRVPSSVVSQNIERLPAKW